MTRKSSSDESAVDSSQETSDLAYFLKIDLSLLRFLNGGERLTQPVVLCLDINYEFRNAASVSLQPLRIISADWRKEVSSIEASLRAIANNKRSIPARSVLSCVF